MLKKHLFLSLFFLMPCLVLAQTTISGKVVDTDSKEPVAGANVFLSNTTIGGQTNADGRFSFRTTQTGSFTLAASFIGYSPKASEIFIEEGKNITRTFELKMTGIELDEIVVTGNNEEWFRRFKPFKQFFIGMGTFTDDVQLLNAEVIDFDLNSSTGLITAKTKAPLRFQNNALGYVVEADFVEVEFNPNDYSGLYIMYSNFIEMEEESESQRKEWEKNRKTAYEGSPAHFFSSLMDDRVRPEGFVIFPEGGDLRELQDPNLMHEFFPKDWLTIVERYRAYEITESQAKIGYNVRFDPTGKRRDDSGDISYISYGSNAPFLLVSRANGYLYNPNMVRFFGKWADERASVMLPRDYKHK
jgi:hypothetical protein